MFSPTNKQSKRLEILVGYFFTISIIILIIFSLLMMFRSKWFFLLNTYVAYYEYGNDIKPGTTVTLNGIDIGEVKKVDIDEENRVKVYLSVWKKYKKKIRKDSVAKIVRPLLIGNKQINITPGSPQAQMLSPGSVILSEESSELVDLVSGISLQNLIDDMGLNPKSKNLSEEQKIKVREIYDKAIASLVTMNELQIAMKSMSESMSGFSSNMVGMSESMEDMGKSMKEMSKFSAAMNDMNYGMKDMAKSFRDMNNNLGQFNPASEKLAPILEEIEILILAMQHSMMFKKEVEKVRKQKQKEKENQKK